jgi:pimeloyl-ACP methyl ester carboxylesterase
MLDMRNHGRSIQSEEFSYEIMAKDIYDYCQANNLNNIDLIGHSMGGKTAMLFAATYPEIVDKMISQPKFYHPAPSIYFGRFKCGRFFHKTQSI